MTERAMIPPYQESDEMEDSKVDHHQQSTHRKYQKYKLEKYFFEKLV